MDADPEAQVMMVEQFIAEAQSGFVWGSKVKYVKMICVDVGMCLIHVNTC